MSSPSRHGETFTISSSNWISPQTVEACTMSPLSLPVTPRRRENWVGLPADAVYSLGIVSLSMSLVSGLDLEGSRTAETDCTTTDSQSNWFRKVARRRWHLPAHTAAGGLSLASERARARSCSSACPAAHALAGQRGACRPRARGEAQASSNSTAVATIMPGRPTRETRTSDHPRGLTAPSLQPSWSARSGSLGRQYRTLGCSRPKVLALATGYRCIRAASTAHPA